MDQPPVPLTPKGLRLRNLRHLIIIGGVWLVVCGWSGAFLFDATKPKELKSCGLKNTLGGVQVPHRSSLHSPTAVHQAAEVNGSFLKVLPGGVGAWAQARVVLGRWHVAIVLQKVHKRRPAIAHQGAIIMTKMPLWHCLAVAHELS